MSSLFSPLQLLSVALAGWMNRYQQAVIDYLVAENQLLKEQLDGRRLQLTDNQRRRLAVKAKALGRQGLRELETLFTADTLLAWHRKLVAEKWTHSREGPRSTTGFARARRTGAAHGVRESTLGLQANGGGAEQSGTYRVCEHGPQHTEAPWD